MEIHQLYEIFRQHPVVTTDSRDCPEGSLFFALKGDTFNGNAYAQAALDSGCAYAVVDEAAYATDPRVILVDDVLHTLQQLANYHRRQLGTPIVGVTGTNGKTTTKELISTVLSKKYNTHFTKGNFNNHIGVPKTLLQLTPAHEMAVIEMGANHPGEIKTLVDIVEPDYGIITNVGKAHLLGFGSFEGVIKTKGELYDYLREHGGKIFLNNDNPYLKGISCGLESITYGQHDAENLSVKGELLDCSPFLHFKWNDHDVQTHLIGAYNIDNALAAATIGHYFGVPDDDISQAMADYVPSNNRSQLEKTKDNTIIIDAYNANPTSMAAALQNFKLMKSDHKMCILGNMGELGDVSAEEHQKIVDMLQEMSFEKVWLVGEEFVKTPCPETFVLFNNVEEVKQVLSAEKPKGMTILVKGSNSTRMFELPKYL
jgi:UDP-N-acetylmuramoyl-tripeptide--D-alanyl-D-alanine ligase